MINDETITSAVRRVRWANWDDRPRVVAMVLLAGMPGELRRMADELSKLDDDPTQVVSLDMVIGMLRTRAGVLESAGLEL